MPSRFVLFPFFRHIEAIGKKLIMSSMYTDEDKMKCPKCKEHMHIVEKKLYLLPCHFGEEHDESSQYYVKNAILCKSEENIPVGQRAAYCTLFSCDVCAEKKVSVVDFLQVRDQTMAKGGGLYDYQELRQLFE